MPPLFHAPIICFLLPLTPIYSDDSVVENLSWLREKSGNQNTNNNLGEASHEGF
jgi:hypothetical protein